MTYEADAAGFLQVVAGEGDTLAIGAVIARLLGSAAEAAAAPAAGNGASAAEPTPASAPAPAPAEPVASVPAPAAAAPPPAPAPGARVKASPVARRIAAELGVDLATVTGTGPDGRIVKADVVAAGERAPAATAAAPGPRRRSPTRPARRARSR